VNQPKFFEKRTDSNDPKLAAKVIKEGDFNLKDLKPGEHTLVVSTN